MNYEEIEPVGKKILIKVVRPSEILKGGLIIKNTYENNRTEDAEVLKVGKSYVGEIKAGDKLLIKRGAYQSFNPDDEVKIAVIEDKDDFILGIY